MAERVSGGATIDEVTANVAAQVSMLVLTLKPGEQLVIDRNDDDANAFRVRRRRGEAGASA